MKIYISPKDLKPGIIALEDVVTPSGQILALAGAELTRQIINKMKLYKVESAAVDTDDPIVRSLNSKKEEPVIPAEPVVPVMPVAPVEPVAAPTPAPTVVHTPVMTTNETLTANNLFSIQQSINLDPAEGEKVVTYKEETQSNSRRMMVSTEFKGFQVDYLLYIEYVKEVFHDILHTPGYQVDVEKLIEKMQPLYASRNTIVELFDMLSQMHSLADTVYAHSVNVALISRMIGRWLHLRPHDLDILTCSGLLHDIGKLNIPEDVLNKPGKLTDEEFAMIKAHPSTGYEMLRQQDFDTRIKQAALTHHERFDGSGYPNKVSREFLSDFAMIVAIADVYDAMTAARSYREPLCAFQVVENFEKEGFQKYHPKYIYVFLHNIASIYQSNRVMLNDGRGCKIVMLNQNTLSKPIVQFDNGACIDLSSQKELFITKIL